VKPNVKVTLSITACGAILLSSIVTDAQVAPVSSPRVGGAQTNQLSTTPRLERIRRRLGEGKVDLLTSFKRKEWENVMDERTGGTPAYTVEDGVYQLMAAPSQPSEEAQMPGTDLGGDDSSPSSDRVPIAFSYPAAFSGAGESGAALGATDNPEKIAAMTPMVFERANNSRSEDNLAWSDGASKSAATLDGYIPADAPLRAAPKPNVIIPEPNALALIAMFAGALMIFSRRRAAIKSVS
jgi:hypothetical protein